MQNTLEVTRSITLADVKDLANAGMPCVTIYMPLEPAPNASRMDYMRLKGGIRQAEQKLIDTWPELSKAQVRELIDPLRTVESEATEWGSEGGSLVILRSPEVFRAFQVNQELDETTVIGEFFHLFPMLHALNVAQQEFYLLALSQKHVRLLRCTPTNSEQVDLPEGTPASLEEWLTTRSPNHASDKVRGANDEGRTEGNFTSTSDLDNKDQHLANFFRAINKAVFETLRNETAPLVLCGVEYERVMYKQNNSYPNLMEEGVQGSPESLKGGDMHARALTVVQEHFAGPAKKALQLWEKLGGSTRVATSFGDIVKAAFEGRIAHLFAAEGAQTMGVFDRNTMQMRVQGRQEDLVNAAALQTIALGGDVFTLQPEHMPAGGQLNAILRF
jgi:hypothetical protein